jgi:hypothetical protein
MKTFHACIIALGIAITPALLMGQGALSTADFFAQVGMKVDACSYTTASGTQNNVDVFALCSPAGPNAVLRITPDAVADATITGIVLPSNQWVQVVIGDPGTGLRAVILNNENASSTATNRLILPSQSNQCTLNRGDSFIMWKDPTSDRVRIMSGDGYVCGA